MLATFYAKIKIFYVIERNVEMQFILRFIKNMVFSRCILFSMIGRYLKSQLSFETD